MGTILTGRAGGSARLGAGAQACGRRWRRRDEADPEGPRGQDVGPILRQIGEAEVEEALIESGVGNRRPDNDMAGVQLVGLGAAC